MDVSFVAWHCHRAMDDTARAQDAGQAFVSCRMQQRHTGNNTFGERAAALDSRTRLPAWRALHARARAAGADSMVTYKSFYTRLLCNLPHTYHAMPRVSHSPLLLLLLLPTCHHCLLPSHHPLLPCLCLFSASSLCPPACLSLRTALPPCAQASCSLPLSPGWMMGPNNRYTTTLTRAGAHANAMAHRGTPAPAHGPPGPTHPAPHFTHPATRGGPLDGTTGFHVSAGVTMARPKWWRGGNGTHGAYVRQRPVRLAPLCGQCWTCYARPLAHAAPTMARRQRASLPRLISVATSRVFRTYVANMTRRRSWPAWNYLLRAMYANAASGGCRAYSR